MFNFFKKKDSASNSKKEEIQMTEEQKNELNEKTEEIQNSIKNLNEEDSKKREEILATLYEELGLTYFNLGEIDKALEALEQSLEYKLTIGEGYKKLMSIYNTKRAEAARNKNDKDIEKYMNKMDDMRNIAKKVTLTGK